MNNFVLEKSVMRRVYLIWMGRLLTHRVTIKLALFAFLLWELAAYVFVRAVLENASHAFGPSYFLGAFMHTQLITQAIILGIVLLAGWLGWDALKNFRYARLQRTTV